MFSRKQSPDPEAIADGGDQGVEVPVPETKAPDFFPSDRPDAESPEVVRVAEKISGVISPYFIALVGLYLYEHNSFFGFLLIGTGVLSLLKISLFDLGRWSAAIKDFFTND